MLGNSQNAFNCESQVQFSMPSIVLGEVTLYGSIRAGVESVPHNTGTAAAPVYSGSTVGVGDFTSRWGFKGSNEVAEGLTAVYRYETKLNSSEASLPGGRLSYVGISGGFGTITAGQIWSASYNSVGAMTDNSVRWGDSETTYRVGDAVSYAVSVGNLSVQADAIMDSSTKKTSDSYQIGATVSGLMETASVAVAHIKHADMAVTYDPTPTVANRANDDGATDNDNMTASGTLKGSSSFLVGQYGIGGMTLYLGVGSHTSKNGMCAMGSVEPDIPGNNNCAKKIKGRTTFAGVRGAVGDTGVSYVFQFRKKKTTTTSLDTVATVDAKTGEDAGTADDVAVASSSPWYFLLSRGLGGGTSVHFEYANPDMKGTPASTGVFLKVDF